MLFSVGYKSRVDSNSMLAANQRMINREVTRKKQEYENRKEVLQISKLYDTKKVENVKNLVINQCLRIFPLFTVTTNIT